jgi:hypothetical protein
MTSIANASTSIADRPRRRFPAGHGGAFPPADKPGAIRASANPLAPLCGPSHASARLRRFAFVTPAALQKAAATLMATSKSS